MSIYESELWKSDIDEVINSLPELQELEEKSVMITGAAGLICSSIVDIFMRYNDTHEKKILFFAAGRWLEEMKAGFQHL